MAVDNVKVFNFFDDLIARHPFHTVWMARHWAPKSLNQRLIAKANCRGIAHMIAS